MVIEIAQYVCDLYYYLNDIDTATRKYLLPIVLRNEKQLFYTSFYNPTHKP